MNYISLILIISSWDISSLDWWKGMYSDGKYVISSPSRWDKGDWLASTFIMGTCGNIMLSDEKTQDWVQANRNSTSDNITKVIEPFGGEGAILALGGLYLTGCIKKDTTLKKVALLCGESALISGVIVRALKILIGRARPSIGEGAYSYAPFNINASNHSFPSGSTSTAFAIASCITEECKNPLVKAASYGMAVLVGLSRIHDNKHWASDVFLGGVIGIGVGKTISKLHKK